VIETAFAPLIAHYDAHQGFYNSLGALVTVGTILACFRDALVSSVRKAYGLYAKIFKHGSPPTETLRIVDQGRGRWQQGNANGRPIMQLSGNFWITNILPTGNAVVKIDVVGERIINGFSPPEELPAQTGLQQPWSTMIDRRPPWFHRHFKARLDFVDVYGNRHRLIATFAAPHKVEKPKQRARENLAAIADPIEADVVAVLRTELTRYENCGRIRGGLGSVEFVAPDKRTFQGPPPDWRSPDTGKNQSIAPDYAAWTLQSDNLTALLTRFAQATTEERNRGIAALLARIDKRTEFAPVGYFIWLALFELGELDAALPLLKAKLMGDDKFGFSDTLRLIDAMMMVQHHRFSKADLGEIHQFLEGITEHTFRIDERLAAVQTQRIFDAPSRAAVLSASAEVALAPPPQQLPTPSSPQEAGAGDAPVV
jgi:hypothetical protein